MESMQIFARQGVRAYYKSDKSREPQSIDFKANETTEVPSFIWAELLKKAAIRKYLDHGILLERPRVQPEAIEIPVAQKAAEEIGAGEDAAVVVERAKGRR